MKKTNIMIAVLLLLPLIVVGIASSPSSVIVFKCKKCGQIRKNKAAKDDDMDMIIKLSANH